jgi:hypothetical protein
MFDARNAMAAMNHALIRITFTGVLIACNFA